jgi:hypothetical protein
MRNDKAFVCFKILSRQLPVSSEQNLEFLDLVGIQAKNWSGHLQNTNPSVDVRSDLLGELYSNPRTAKTVNDLNRDRRDARFREHVYL